MCNITLAARGASVVFGVEYANYLDTLIHKRTYGRRNLFTLGFFGVRLLLLLVGAANVKYGRRSRFEI